MGTKDKKLVERAKYEIDASNYSSLGIDLIAQCESQEAKDKIDSYMARAYHQEESLAGFL